jgi:hypothetical protein
VQAALGCGSVRTKHLHLTAKDLDIWAKKRSIIDAVLAAVPATKVV